MEIIYSLLAVSPFAYCIFASVIIQVIRANKGIGLSKKNYFRSYIYLAPSEILSIIAVSIIPFDKYNLFPPVIISFLLPILFSFLLLLGLYDITKEKNKNKEQINAQSQNKDNSDEEQ